MELEALVRDLGASAFRGSQLATWPFRKGVGDLDAMTDLPQDFRERLAARATLALPEVERRMIEDALRDCGTKTGAAERLGLSRQSLQQMLRRRHG